MADLVVKEGRSPCRRRARGAGKAFPPSCTRAREARFPPQALT
ncbi:hypothetical protein HMPREF9440_01563 [Sutterella parvirubra YIT 11816]|uniref:Uncharacterized protein n=1 Tax=Sutterella parvirubra YIT 11816 TaxID=762967 RepID=H3KFP3_9BURK|nr:hypothetical protein HMPREF9440_01563 [Sutterella parvirubra YIT 11816]